MELAPDEASAPEKMEIKFQKKTEDHGVEAARSWMSTELENTDTEDYFTADVGEVMRNQKVIFGKNRRRD